MSNWWEQPYQGGKMVDVPGFPGPLYPPDAKAQGKAPTVDTPAALALKRVVARLGRWEWNPEAWDDDYSDEFAHGRSGGDVASSGLAGVQRQAKLKPTGWVDQETFNLLRSVKIPEGLPNAGQMAMDGVARKLLAEAWEEAQRAKVPRLADVRVTPTGGSPHWGGSHDVLEQFVAPFLARLKFTNITSKKRNAAESKAVGSSQDSDHFDGNLTAAAYDFGTRDGEAGARSLAAAMGYAAWRPNSYDGFRFSAGGHAFRGQILWGGQIGHADHIHVGVKRA
jgi:hypothetical protein